MARSNTLPVNPPPQSDGDGKQKRLERSATTRTRASEPADDRDNTYIPQSDHRDHAPPLGSSPGWNAPPPPRPAALDRQNSVHTQYMTMLLAMDTIPRWHNLLSSFFTFILLAGFVIFPSTFTNISASEAIASSHTATEILNSVKHVPLLVIAGVCCGIGAGGMIWLWWRWRENSVFLLNKLFLPGCLNSLTGLISTLINVYGQQGGNWSITAKVTAIVTGAVMLVTGCLFLLYNYWILGRVKSQHGLEMNRSGDETLVEKIERKTHEPGLEPGSVV